MKAAEKPVDVLIVAVPETAGSALYGMVDVLLAAGNIWQTLANSGAAARLFNVRIVSTRKTAFRCGNGIPVRRNTARSLLVRSRASPQRICPRYSSRSARDGSSSKWRAAAIAACHSGRRSSWRKQAARSN